MVPDQWDGGGSAIYTGGPGQWQAVLFGSIYSNHQPKALYQEAGDSSGFKHGKFVTTWTDHYPCIITLEGLPRVDIKEVKEKRWNLTKEGGWNRYEVLLVEQCKKMDSVIEDKD